MRFLAVLLATLLPLSAAAANRVALVIGNDRYEAVAALQKATNDARAVSDTLAGLGFDVITGLDAGRREMNRLIQDFANRVRPGDVAMFYYAGHAIEIEGENFLLPIDIPDAAPGQEAFVRAEAVALNHVLRVMGDARARMNIAVLDSCRNNPFAAANGRGVGGTRGLSRIAPPRGTFVMYSADAGEAALDRLSDVDGDPNSVFTRALLPLMRTEGLTLVELARRARREVSALAATVSHSQTPAYYDATLGDFRFFGEAQTVSMNPPTPTPPPPPADATAETLFWRSVTENPSRDAYQAYLNAYPQGLFAPLARLALSRLENASAAPTPPATDLRRRAAALAKQGVGPSYDCARAQSRDEVTICGDRELAAYDHMLADAYKAAIGRLRTDGRKDLRASQRVWLKDRRACPDAACLSGLYESRIGYLERL